MSRAGDISVAHSSMLLLEFRIETLPSGSPPMIFCSSSAWLICSGVRAVGRRHELVEERPGESQRQFAGQIVRLGQILRGQFAQALLAVNGHENRRHQSDQSLIGADVGRGFLAADVLFASGQREAKRAIAVAYPWFRPTMRPGIWRMNFSLVAMMPANGPP